MRYYVAVNNPREITSVTGIGLRAECGREMECNEADWFARLIDFIGDDRSPEIWVQGIRALEAVLDKIRTDPAAESCWSTLCRSLRVVWFAAMEHGVAVETVFVDDQPTMAARIIGQNVHKILQARKTHAEEIAALRSRRDQLIEANNREVEQRRKAETDSAISLELALTMAREAKELRTQLNRIQVDQDSARAAKA